MRPYSFQKELKPGTIYTITIRKGLPLKGTDLVLSENYAFSFETAPEQDPGRNEQKGTLSFHNLMMEFGTQNAPVIPLSIYSANNVDREAVVKTTVYQFKNTQAFIDALKSKYTTPNWAYVSQQSNLISTEGLADIASFEQTFDLTKWQQKYLVLPESLNSGFYLVESTYNDLTAQVLIQSTDLAAYFTKRYRPLWVNNLKSGKASFRTGLCGERGENYTTDARVSQLLTQSRILQTIMICLIMLSVRRKRTDLINSRYRTYWDDPYARDDYWRYFQTDRNPVQTR